MESRPRVVEFFELADGKYPAKDWLFAIKSREDRQRILRRLEHLQAGTEGIGKDWVTASLNSVSSSAQAIAFISVKTVYN